MTPLPFSHASCTKQSCSLHSHRVLCKSWDENEETNPHTSSLITLVLTEHACLSEVAITQVAICYPVNLAMTIPLTLLNMSSKNVLRYNLTSS